MPEKDRRMTAHYGPGPEPGQTHASLAAARQARIGGQLRESTSPLIAALQARLARLRAAGDPRVEELATLCEKELDQISEQIGALSQDESASDWP